MQRQFWLSFEKTTKFFNALWRNYDFGLPDVRVVVDVFQTVLKTHIPLMTSSSGQKIITINLLHQLKFFRKCFYKFKTKLNNCSLFNAHFCTYNAKVLSLQAQQLRLQWTKRHEIYTSSLIGFNFRTPIARKRWIQKEFHYWKSFVHFKTDDLADNGQFRLGWAANINAVNWFCCYFYCPFVACHRFFLQSVSCLFCWVSSFFVWATFSFFTDVSSSLLLLLLLLFSSQRLQ